VTPNTLQKKRNPAQNASSQSSLCWEGEMAQLRTPTHTKKQKKAVVSLDLLEKELEGLGNA